MTDSILVVGGGIAGRAVARVLARHGLGCTVVERRESVGRGMGVNLPGNAVRALAELGVPDQALTSGMPVRRREYRNGRGRLLFAVDDEHFWRDVGRPVCVRHGDLLEALALPEAATLEHAQAMAARPTPAGVEVEVELEGAPSPRHVDFVIGADGVHSGMREAVAVDGLRPSSMTGSSWRFVAANPGIDCWTAWAGRDETFLLIPVGEGRVYGYAARTRGGNTGSDRSWLARAAEGFPEPVSAAVTQALQGSELHHGRVDEVRLEQWHNGRLVLIGDAAHATGPVWAQGVAMALEDAQILGALLALTPAEHWAGVGPAFERLRRPRVEHVQWATDKMSRLAALPGWLRDASAPLLGPRSYRAAYAPLRNVSSKPGT
jgi:2-polyprenyl-6-methoxyphenol hydroxylase-like FAD-dependent oxidoreductase